MRQQVRPRSLRRGMLVSNYSDLSAVDAGRGDSGALERGARGPHGGQPHREAGVRQDGALQSDGVWRLLTAAGGRHRPSSAAQTRAPTPSRRRGDAGAQARDRAMKETLRGAAAPLGSAPRPVRAARRARAAPTRVWRRRLRPRQRCCRTTAASPCLEDRRAAGRSGLLSETARASSTSTTTRCRHARSARKYDLRFAQLANDPKISIRSLIDAASEATLSITSTKHVVDARKFQAGRQNSQDILDDDMDAAFAAHGAKMNKFPGLAHVRPHDRVALSTCRAHSGMKCSSGLEAMRPLMKQY